jgi:hypothetical protein
MQMGSGLDAIFTLARCFYSIKLRTKPKVYRLSISFSRFPECMIALKDDFIWLRSGAYRRYQISEAHYSVNLATLEKALALCEPLALSHLANDKL